MIRALVAAASLLCGCATVEDAVRMEQADAARCAAAGAPGSAAETDCRLYLAQAREAEAREQSRRLSAFGAKLRQAGRRLDRGAPVPRLPRA